MLVAPNLVLLIMLFNIAKLPVLKGSYSKTPYGPFHTMVFALEMASLFLLLVKGPESNPINPLGIPYSAVKVLI